MKILLISSCPKWASYNFISALSKVYTKVNITGNITESSYGIVFDKEEWDSLYIPPDKVDYKDYDVIMGIDHGVIRILRHIQAINNKAIYGVQILDFPKHVFDKTKDYNESVVLRWRYEYALELKYFDFTIHNQKNSLKYLEDYLNSHGKHAFIRFPVKAIEVAKGIKNNHIIYSGRVHPDKGVHYILSALSLLDKDIRPIFYTIGNGFDFKPFAKHLGVEYHNIPDMDEVSKWNMYNESKAIICGADNPYIPALCILEGISIGVPGICWDYDESRLHYKDYAFYVTPTNINDMSKAIGFVCQGGMSHKKDDGIEFYNKECTYEAWASKVKEMIDESER